jgi:hypothetical protein
VEREDRHLDREPEEQRAEDPVLLLERELAGLAPRDDRLHVERLRTPEVQEQQTEEHDDRADERVDEELHARVAAVVPAPDPDHEEHRDEHELPEYIEQHRIEREEHSDHADLQQQEQEAERLHLLLEPQRVESAQEAQQRGEEHEWQRQPVDADLVGHAHRRNPRDRLSHLHAGRPDAESGEDRKREAERARSRHHREPLDDLLPGAGQEQ